MEGNHGDSENQKLIQIEDTVTSDDEKAIQMPQQLIVRSVMDAQL
jgi:hypothetical protein